MNIKYTNTKIWADAKTIIEIYMRNSVDCICRHLVKGGEGEGVCLEKFWTLLEKF